MSESLRILHLEDEPLDSELAQEALRAEGIQVVLDRVDTLADFKTALDRSDYSLVLSDYTIPGADPLEALKLTREKSPELPFIFLSGTIGERKATQALKLGANDYVLKQKIEHLAPTVHRALSEAQEQRRRKQAEDALRRSEERLRLAQEIAGIGIFECNMISGTCQWSAEMESLHGLTPGAFCCRYEDWRQRLYPEDRPVLDHLVHGASETGRFEGEWRVIWPDGSLHWLAVRGHLFKDAQGHPARLLGVNLEITQRKLSEANLKRAKDAAEDASKAKDRFLAILSHELRTPLTAVMPALDSIEPLLPPEGKDLIDMAIRNIELEARLIDDLLDVTRIARGKIELNRQAVDLSAALRRAAEVCQADITAHNQHFNMIIEGAPHTVSGDPARLQQVFWNLIQNAVKFTPKDGCIGVRAWRENGRSVVEVSDSGAGIEAEALDRIFNAFEQEGRSITRQFGGLGLGLAICKVLVEMHGGSIHAFSEGRGKGATFRAEFPLAEQAILPARDSGRRRSENNARHRALRILLVEDHPDTARILSLLLRKAGHQVSHAADVANALDMAKTEQYDLLLSDLGLPDGSGVDLMYELRRRGVTMPGIAVSGYGQEEDLRRTRDAGFVQHLVKPVSSDRLLNAIAGAAGASAGEQGAIAPH